MALSIHTNPYSLNTQRALSNTTWDVQTTMQRLSSGKRINNAADDAAGLAISQRMSTLTISQSAISRGINDGISLCKTAEGGLSVISEILQRARELAVQASNGSLNTSDRNALNQEFTAIIQEIDGIATNTQVFGLYPFGSNQVSASPSLDIFPDPLPADGSGRTFSSGIIPFSVIPINSTNVSFNLNSGALDDDIQLFTKNGKHLVGTNLSDSTWSSRGITDATTAGTVLLSQSGFNSGASYDGSNLLDGLNNNPGTTLTGSYNGMNISYAGDYNWAGNLNESLTIDKVTEDLLLFVVGNGSFTASGSVTPPVTVGPIKITLESGYRDSPEYLSIDRKPSDITSLGLYGTSVNSQSSSSQAITKLDAAIKMVGEYRAYFGANEARLEIAHQQNKSLQIATEAAVGKIVDTDYAVEMSNLTRGRILQSSGESALVKANASTENVLDLLKPYRS